MNRYENPPEPQSPRPSFTTGFIAPFGPGIGVLLMAALIGWGAGEEAPGRIIKGLVYLHIAALGMDLYTLFMAWLFRRRGILIVIPYTAPIIFACVRLLLYGICVNKLFDPHIVHTSLTSPFALISLFAILSMAFCIYEGIMIRTGLCPPMDMIHRSEAPPADLPVGPEYTYEIQTILRSLGYYHGQVDGVLTQEVKEAIKRFQDSVGLMPHGGLTAATVIELRKLWERHQMRALGDTTDRTEGNGQSVWSRLRNLLR